MTIFVAISTTFLLKALVINNIVINDLVINDLIINNLDVILIFESVISPYPIGI